MNLLAVFIGTFAGIVIGALPGLSTVMGLSILLPFTLSFSGMGGMYCCWVCSAAAFTAAPFPPFC